MRRTAALLLCALSLPACAMAEAKAPASPAEEMFYGGNRGPEPAVVGEIAMGGMATGLRSGDKDGVADERLATYRPPPANRPGGPPPPPPPPPPGTPEPAKADAGQVAQIRAPMLIYTAQITMAVFEVAAGLAKVEALGKELGGFVAKRDDRSVTIRVPAARFDDAVGRIEVFGDMVHRNVQAEDVTEQFHDLEVRLGTARAVRQRLTELLAKAVKVEDSLAIERELDRVVGEIERLEGKVKFLRDRAAFSTITVSFDAKPKEQVGGGQVRLPVPWLHNLGLRRLLSL
jgi:hypothetical protein